MFLTQRSMGSIAPRPVVIVALITAICLLGDSALYTILPSKLDDFAVSPAGIGLILGINRYIRVFSNTAAGWMFGWLGFRRPFLLAIALAGITTFSYGLFPGFWPLFLAHGIWGISWSLLRLGGYLTVIEAGTSANIGRFMGVLYGVARGGSLVAVLLGGALADSIGSREAFLIFGGLTLLAFGLVPFGKIPKTLGRRQETKASNPGSIGSTATEPHAFFITVINILALIFGLLVSGLMVATAGYLMRTVASDGVTIARLTIGVGLLSGLLVGVRWLSDLGMGPVFGHISDKIGRAKVILSSSVIIMAMLGLVAAGQSLIVIFPAVSVLFLASGALIVVLNASIGELAPAGRRAAVLSRYATWQDVGSGTGPLVGFFLVTHAGLGWTYGGGAVLMGAAGLLYLWAVKRRESISPQLETSATV